MTFKRPTGAGLLALAIIAGLCTVALVEPALAQAATDAAKDAAPAARLPQPLPYPTRATPPGCLFPARSF